MDACMETFVTLIKFMMLMNSSSLTKVWRGLGQSVIDDAMYEWHKRLCSGRVHVRGGILSI